MLGERNNWRSENLWKIIPLLPPALAGIAISLGVDYRYASASTLILLLWVWHAHQVGPSPVEDPEFAFLRNIRVELYFAGLLFYIFLALATLAISAPVALLLYGVLYPIRALLLRGLFALLTREDERTIEPRGRDEKLNLDEMRLRVGGSIIYLSWALLAVISLANFEFFVTGAINTASPIDMISFVSTTALAVFVVYWQSRRAYTREVESLQYAKNLADSLRRRRWARRFDKKP